MGPVTALLVVKFFSPEVQGYYYTFGSILSIRFLAEVGLNEALIQFASHEWAKLRFDKEGYITGDEEFFSRLLSLFRISTKWYGVVIIIAFPAIYIIGLLLFSSHNGSVNWSSPWLFLCISSAISFALIPIYSLLQGCGQVEEYWFYRLIQQIISGLSIWITIYSFL